VSANCLCHRRLVRVARRTSPRDGHGATARGGTPGPITAKASVDKVSAMRFCRHDQPSAPSRSSVTRPPPKSTLAQISRPWRKAPCFPCSDPTLRDRFAAPTPRPSRPSPGCCPADATLPNSPTQRSTKAPGAAGDRVPCALVMPPQSPWMMDWAAARPSRHHQSGRPYIGEGPQDQVPGLRQDRHDHPGQPKRWPSPLSSGLPRPGALQHCPAAGRIVRPSSSRACHKRGERLTWRPPRPLTGRGCAGIDRPRPLMRPITADRGTGACSSELEDSMQCTNAR